MSRNFKSFFIIFSIDLITTAYTAFTLQIQTYSDQIQPFILQNVTFYFHINFFTNQIQTSQIYFLNFSYIFFIIS